MDKIIGNTTATPMVVPDLAQTDPKKADFIKNKRVSELVNDMGYLTKEDIPNIGGANITIDDKMSDTSKNPVQNKVVKKYVDDSVPTKISDLEDDLQFGMGISAIGGMANNALNEALRIETGITDGTIIAHEAHYAAASGHALHTDRAMSDWQGNSIIGTYAKKPIISTLTDTTYTFDFSDNYNKDVRCHSVDSISIIFQDDEYALDYISGLSFDSGETPTGFDYTASGIINWVGTDCTKDGDVSIFQPSANTHYDIVFYFNGMQFIGLVNGFVPASGNVVSE